MQCREDVLAGPDSRDVEMESILRIIVSNAFPRACSMEIVMRSMMGLRKWKLSSMSARPIGLAAAHDWQAQSRIDDKRKPGDNINLCLLHY